VYFEEDENDVDRNLAYTDKKENQIFLIKRKFRVEQLLSHTVCEEGLPNI
jgi:hypothetical protein